MRTFSLPKLLNLTFFVFAEKTWSRMGSVLPTTRLHWMSSFCPVITATPWLVKDYIVIIKEQHVIRFDLYCNAALVKETVPVQCPLTKSLFPSSGPTNNMLPSYPVSNFSLLK